MEELENAVEREEEYKQKIVQLEANLKEERECTKDGNGVLLRRTTQLEEAEANIRQLEKKVRCGAGDS
jgi:hypothetical protein